MTIHAIETRLYLEYFTHLVQGDVPSCVRLVRMLLDESVPLQTVYLDLLQPALYEVGDRWSCGNLSVGVEHLASASTAQVMRQIYDRVAGAALTGQTAMIACIANEYHQIGGRMVADLLEQRGWRVAFLGANTPQTDMLDLVAQLRPDLLGLSVTLPENLSAVRQAASAARERFADLPIVVGGQAFALAGEDLSLDHLPNVRQLGSVHPLLE